MKGDRRVPRLYGLVGIALLVVAAACRDSQPARQDVDGFELTYFPSGRMLGIATLGFDALAADYAFLRAAQYYGMHRRTDRQFPWAYHLFNVVTELDPRFLTAYLFGGMVVAEDMGRLDLATSLLARGMDQFPDCWELPFEAGFLTFVTKRDPSGAARWFERARKLPGAPEYVRKFAAYAHLKAGDHVTALALWREIARTSEQPALREVARRYIGELEAELAIGEESS